ncbi:hypothetical protein WBG78_27055 [Chryseolinea sp. T2]|uniref:hypothetical protein n=1 Tax=Chryseolinea sp. T2 TaxID=3129255 RepID=UPI0030784E85
MQNNFIRVWKYPVLLAALTVFGLLAALAGTGIWHLLSWLALAVPVASCIRFGFFPGRGIGVKKTT